MQEMPERIGKHKMRNISGWEDTEQEIKTDKKRTIIKKRTLYLFGISIYATEYVEKDE